MGIGQYLSLFPLTTLLMLINIAMSLYVFSNPDKMEDWCFHIGRITRFKENYRMLTSAFIHADGFHLLFNMIALFSFGRLAEFKLGTPYFAILYFGSLLAADWFVMQMKRNNANYRAVGASGAISGVIFAAILFAPMNPIYIFFIPIGIPAVIVGIVFLGASYYFMDGGPNGKNDSLIGHEAHLAGAVAGILITGILEPDSIRVFVARMMSLLF